MCMNRGIAKILAEQIGTVIEIPAESRECWGKFLRVRVRIDITKPLKRCLKVRLEGFEKATMAPIHYERLLDFCFTCRKLGHVMRDCADVEARNEALQGNATRYGVWMKVAATERPKSYTQRRELQASTVKQTTFGECDNLNSESWANRKRQVLAVDGAKTPKPNGMGEGGETRDHPVKEMEEGRRPTHKGVKTTSNSEEPVKDVCKYVEASLITTIRSPQKGSQRKTEDSESVLMERLEESEGSFSEALSRGGRENTVGDPRIKGLLAPGECPLGTGPLSIIKILSWNVRGLGNPRAFLALKRVLKRFSPSLVFLSETKLHKVRPKGLGAYWVLKGYFKWIVKGKSRGLLMLWKDWDVTVQSFSKGYIDVRVKMDNSVLWRFSGFYGSPTQANCAASWELLRRLKSVDNLPWVCGGDFNEILSTKEKLGGSDRQKLRGCARKLKAWSKDKFGSLGKLITSKRAELEGLVSRAREVGISKDITRVEVRKKSNWIEVLEDDDSRKFFDEADISGAARRYFEAFFTSSTPSGEDMDSCSEMIKSRIDNDMWLVLEERFVDEEVRLAVFSLGPTKAPSPDGFHALFFQKFWKIVGADVSRVCLKVLNGEISINPFNKTNMVLIPKTKNPINMKDFRPISLCSVVYKIVSKAMATHLKGILPEIISPNQSAFVPVILIFVNVLIAFELLHSIGKRRKGKKGFMTLKIDMSKAYDRVEWRFLKCIMMRMGFPLRWINLVIDCISTSSLGVVINGKISSEVFPSRGIRQ
ncbi:hypothetical protein Dsin_005005 [Dipteronia sinensis]|uniref:CCHC-type domain-containing protein n=1 Tax=Dipteronia sinensis TaxID=43782 RepID=A0AAE0EE78_9ROSI|nr:hypothetical protein Dsin_005005 [Dipteronia sinensis]